MKKQPFFCWFLSIFLLWLPAVAQSAVGDTEVKIHVHTSLKPPHVMFDAETQTWLDHASTIRVAFWGGARPPLHIGFDPNCFEGITADLLGLLQDTLGVPFQMLRFESRVEAIEAIARGEVDMLALNDATDASNPVFKTSRPYLLNSKVIVRRISDKLKPKKGIERLAYIGSTDAHITRIQNQHPHTQLIPYANHLSAFAALAYGQIDAIRTNAVTAEFLLSSFYRNELYITQDTSGGVADINFAVSVRHPLLLKAINDSLAAIPLADMLQITTNWMLSDKFVVARKSLELNDEQKAWISNHSKLKVIVVDAYAPLSFFDENNQFNGLSADVLNIIEKLTGLQFEIIRSDSVREMVEQLQNRKVDLIAALSISDFRLDPSQYTRPYMISPFVVVTRRSDLNVRGLDDMNGLRLALPWGSPLSSVVRDNYPHIRQVTVENATQGFEMLQEGKVDGTVHTKFGADYFINNYFLSELHITSALGARPAMVSMAVGPDHQMLKSIINTALLEIRPDELRALIERWHVNQPPAVASSWNTYKGSIFAIIIVAVISVLIFLAWNYHLRIQIQKRQKAERALEDQLEFTRTLIDGTPLVLYVRDREGRLVDCNRAYLDSFGLSKEMAIGKTLPESGVVGVEMSSRYHQAYIDALDKGQPTFADVDVELSGKMYRVYHWILPFLDSSGQYIGVIGGWLDITERMELIEQLRLAKEAAITANRAKSVFLASMSHEIRTPISALIGLIELLRVKGGTASEVEENLEVAHHSAQSLLSLIGNILDLSKIEAGAMSPSPRPTDLVEMVNSIYRLFETNARKKGLDFRLVVEIKHHGVMIDALMLNQVISNLISNAIKFTSQGSVEVLLRELPGGGSEEQSRFAIQVRDTGKGLNDAQRQEIFEPFVQIEPQTHRAVGTGLGLSICASLANLLGAELSVDSQPGLGSCFTLVFDAELAEVITEKEAASTGLPRGQRLRVLVVEDHAPNRLLLCRQLEYLGHEAVPCDDGEAALAEWMSTESSFDLTITDCNMPRMNGYELTSNIREIELNKGMSPHPVFGLTANAQPEITEKCLNAGMSDCLFKPVSLEALASAISKVAPASVRRSSTAVTGGGELAKLKLRNPESYVPLVTEIIRTHREDGANLELFAKENNRPGLVRVAHKVCGGAQLMGDLVLHAACHDLEHVAKQLDAPYQFQVEQVLACLQALESELLEDIRHFERLAKT